MSTDIWIGNASGSWSAGSNWSAGTPPASGSYVIISTSNYQTITHNSGSDTIGGLSLGNDGLVVSSGSTLETGGVLTNEGTLTAASGGLLDIAAGGSSAANGLVIGADSVIEIGGGTFALGAGTVAGVGTLLLAAGTLSLGANNVELALFQQDGGVLAGTGTLTIANGAIFGNAGVSEDFDQFGAGKTLLEGASTIAGSGLFYDTHGLFLADGRIVENQGTLTWSGANIFLGTDQYGDVGGSCTIRNDAGAIFNIQSDMGIYDDAANDSFVNAGLLEKTGKYSYTRIKTSFTNTGTVSVQKGVLEFDAGGSSNGVLTVGVNGRLNFGGGTFTLTNNSLAGAGFIGVTAGTLELGGNNVNIGAASFEQEGEAVIDGTSKLTIDGSAVLGYGGTTTYGATQTGSGTTLLKGATKIESDGLVTLDAYAFALDGGRTIENQGVLSWAGGIIELGRDLQAVLSVGGGTIKNDVGAVFDIQSDDIMDKNYVAGSTGTDRFVNAGLLEKSAATGITDIQVTFTNTGSIAIDSGTLGFSGATEAFSGSIGGAGTLEFGDFSVGTIENGAVVSVAAIAIDGSDGMLVLGERLNYAGTFSETGSANTIALGANTLTLSGTSSLGGTVTGTGTLALAGSGTLTSGAVLAVANFSITGGTAVLGTNLGYAGSFLESAGATVSLSGTDVLTLAGAARIRGTVAGAGTLALTGAETFSTGAVVTAGAMDLAGGTASFATQIDYTGSFVESAGTLALAGQSLTLTGPAKFSGGAVDGPGHLYTDGTTTLAALILGGRAGWVNAGTVDQTGTLTLGDATGTGALVNLAGATFDLIGNSTGIALAAAGGTVNNQGLFEKTSGGGACGIAAGVNNTGTIMVADGTLALRSAVSGTGTEMIGAAGTLEVDGSVSAGQTIAFMATTGGKLVLADPSGNGLSFAGGISGFGGGDVLDLSTFQYMSGGSATWVQNGSSGVLTVTEGSKIAKIMLFGQFAAGGFNPVTDGHAGTKITYTPPAPQLAIAAPHH